MISQLFFLNSKLAALLRGNSPVNEALDNPWRTYMAQWEAICVARADKGAG